ncbi:hypothetical protein B0H11DRAFT_1931384 [Mycena galericulata]|nr:hypothetical protein B0H11DRAFT_1931384 [Mycena galericulata]
MAPSARALRNPAAVNPFCEKVSRRQGPAASGWHMHTQTARKLDDASGSLRFRLRSCGRSGECGLSATRTALQLKAHDARGRETFPRERMDSFEAHSAATTSPAGTESLIGMGYESTVAARKQRGAALAPRQALLKSQCCVSCNNDSTLGRPGSSHQRPNPPKDKILSHFADRNLQKTWRHCASTLESRVSANLYDSTQCRATDPSRQQPAPKDLRIQEHFHACGMRMGLVYVNELKRNRLMDEERTTETFTVWAPMQTAMRRRTRWNFFFFFCPSLLSTIRCAALNVKCIPFPFILGFPTSPPAPSSVFVSSGEFEIWQFRGCGRGRGVAVRAMPVEWNGEGRYALVGDANALRAPHGLFPYKGLLPHRARREDLRGLCLGVGVDVGSGAHSHFSCPCVRDVGRYGNQPADAVEVVASASFEEESKVAPAVRLILLWVGVASSRPWGRVPVQRRLGTGDTVLLPTLWWNACL